MTFRDQQMMIMFGMLIELGPTGPRPNRAQQMNGPNRAQMNPLERARGPNEPNRAQRNPLAASQPAQPAQPASQSASQPAIQPYDNLSHVVSLTPTTSANAVLPPISFAAFTKALSFSSHRVHLFGINIWFRRD